MCYLGKSLWCLLDLKSCYWAHKWQQQGTFITRTKYWAAFRPVSSGISPDRLSSVTEWVPCGQFHLGKIWERLRKHQWMQMRKRKTSVKLIKGKHSFDLLVFSVLSPRWAVLFLLLYSPVMLETNRKELSTKVRSKYTTYFNIHLAVFLWLLHLGNIFFCFCPLSQLWHSCH